MYRNREFIALSDKESCSRPKVHTGPDVARRLALDATTARIVVMKVEGARCYSGAALVFDQDGLVPETCYLVDLPTFERGRPDYQEQFLPEALYCLGYNNPAENYYHWMTQCLTAIYSYTLVEPSARKTVLIPACDGFRRDSLELAGLDVQLFAVEPLTCYNAPEMMISNYLHGAMAYAPSPLVEPLFDKMRDTALARQSSDRRAQMIYVSRSDSPSRRLANEDALAHALSRLGFEILLSSRLSLAEQICVFASADMIIAPHGAGLTNIAFCKPSCKIYELTPDHYVNSCFLNLAQMRGNEYWLESYPSTSEGSLFERGWAVDVGQVEKTAESILRSLGR